VYVHTYIHVSSFLSLAIVHDNIISRNRYAKLFLAELDSVASDATQAESRENLFLSADEFALAGKRKTIWSGT